jgi:2',3'-cyclic-nucleotide 2'-phosphodiesterase (5'-nucleotidase family)
MRRLLAFWVLFIGAASTVWIAGQSSTTHIVIMHTNDMHGQLLPKDGNGGIAEVATIIKSAKPDLILDAGDFSTGTFLADEFLGAPTIQAMNKIGYDASTIGNHEFDYGQAALTMRLREAKFPVLSANVESPVSEIKKFTVLNVRGMRFGIIGLTTEELKTKSHPNKVTGVTVLDTVKTLERLLPEVRKKADFIIATVHLEDDEEKRVASAFPEIRLIIGGHNHEALGPIWLDKTLIAKTGVSTHNVGRVDLDFQNKQLSHMEAKLIPVRNVRPDSDVAKILEPFNEKVRKRMGEVIGVATDDLKFSRTKESPLGDLVADAFRETAKTEIAIQNVGGIRAFLSKGTITWGNAFEVLPFQNTLITLKMTGAQLKKTLEIGLIPSVGMVAVSGLRVQFDPSKPAGEQVVAAALLDGNKIEDSKLYTVSTNDFVLAGGDGFTEFANGTDIVNTGTILRDVLVDYIKTHRKISSQLDGRIVVP